MTPLDPASTVFVDVDTQIDFVEPSGALYVPGADALKPAFSRLLRAAEARAIPVVASADAHPDDDPEFARFPPHCLAGSPGAARVPETAAPEDAALVRPDGTWDPGGPARVTVLEKTAFDLFQNPRSDEVIAATGATTAVVFGVALDYCVRAAALGLRRRGYRTLLVEDATAPVTAEGGAAARAELAEAGVALLTTDAVLAGLEVA
jgi:nicotinamidase/pyrazinamidase